MIYLFAGEDTQKKVASYERFLKSLPEPADIFFIHRSNFDPGQIENFISGRGLFAQRCVVVFLSILEKEEITSFILEKLPRLGEAQNIFIFSESKLSKNILDSFKKARAELNIFELTEEKEEKFNNFILANALEARDKLKLWLYFRQAIKAGVELEPLAGILFWKIKDMFLKKNFKKFSGAELQNLAAKISILLPETRHRGQDAEIAFEQFILETF
jgi:hypothetical protein